MQSILDTKDIHFDSQFGDGNVTSSNFYQQVRPTPKLDEFVRLWVGSGRWYFFWCKSSGASFFLWGGKEVSCLFFSGGMEEGLIDMNMHEHGSVPLSLTLTFDFFKIMSFTQLSSHPDPSNHQQNCWPGLLWCKARKTVIRRFESPEVFSATAFRWVAI